MKLFIGNFTKLAWTTNHTALNLNFELKGGIELYIQSMFVPTFTEIISV